MSKLPGDDLLFSQSELAELDAELAPQPVDEADAASARTPPQQTPITFDEMVDNAFADEETAEKQLVIDPEANVDTTGFDGFVEAEPANTDEIMAVLAERAPISSAPLPSMRVTSGGGAPPGRWRAEPGCGTAPRIKGSFSRGQVFKGSESLKRFQGL